MSRGKRYKQAVEQMDRNTFYAPEEAIKLLKGNAKAKFDETVEAHIRLGIDSRKADQQVRGTATLPHGTGKAARVAVFAQGEKLKEAEDAKADFVGADDLIEKIEKGFTDFDVAIATPDMMSKVGKLGKILGPRGLMPNPKSGTVTFDVGKAVSEVKKGKIEYRTDKTGIVHLVFGKASFSEQALLENYLTLLGEIIRVKPSTAKGKYIKSVSISSTMSPGIKVDLTKTRELLEKK